MGIARGLSVAENLFLRDQRSGRFDRHGFLRRRAIEAHGRRLLADHAIAAPGLGSPASTLSGGNVQKLIAARETEARPLVLIACFPTRGLDVGAARRVLDLVVRERNRGAGIFFISEDVREVLEVADRLSVLFRGRIARRAGRPGELSHDEIALAMTGGSRP
jgi:simple sugar transport system ATP-binding protein